MFDCHVDARQLVPCSLDADRNETFPYCFLNHAPIDRVGCATPVELKPLKDRVGSSTIHGLPTQRELKILDKSEKRWPALLPSEIFARLPVRSL